MPSRTIRAAVVGSSSLVGKELAEQLNASTSTLWDLALLESEDAAGQLTSAGDEALVVRSIASDSFTGLDVVFFAGDSDTAQEHWKAASGAGAAVVDLTGALENQAGLVVACPWIKSAHQGETPIDLETLGIVPAHPAAVMLGLVLARLSERFAEVRAAATVLQPASQFGNTGLDEMHQQTVGLLSFQAVPKDVFDTQVAFNLSATLGEAARVSLQTTSQTVRKHLRETVGADLAQNCALQLVQAPVFNGYTASVFLTLPAGTRVSDVERALAGGAIGVTGPDDAPPSNQGATEQDQVLVQLHAEENTSAARPAFWLWMAADNIRLAARNAIACAGELMALRPGGRVQ